MSNLPSERQAEFLQTHPEWVMQDEKLYQKITFPNFTEAFAFMTKVATIADALDHHPEWKNVYNIVEIWLTTHDAGGITKKDFALAEQIANLHPSGEKDLLRP